jgi:transglutaminase-like putative cysteine protease
LEFTILHQTTYRYPEKIHESYSIVHLQPRTDATQYCTKFELTIAPRVRPFAFSDRFGNDVHHFAVLPDHDVLSVVARSSIITVRPSDPAIPSPVTRADLDADPAVPWLFDELHESMYVVFGPELRAFAAEVGDPGDGDLVAWFLHAGETIKRRLAYNKEATSVTTTVDESIALGAGVCQDFAHVLIALCRFFAIPARYVSGYLYTGQEGAVLGAEASHAWVEIYLGPHGWVGYDPTNACLIDDRFAKIAVGRDYRDVSPIRGVYKGASRSTMSVNVAMEALASAQQQQKSSNPGR